MKQVNNTNTDIEHLLKKTKFMKDFFWKYSSVEKQTHVFLKQEDFLYL